MYGIKIYKSVIQQLTTSKLYVYLFIFCIDNPHEFEKQYWPKALAELEDKWLDKLQPYQKNGY